MCPPKQLSSQERQKLHGPQLMLVVIGTTMSLLVLLSHNSQQHCIVKTHNAYHIHHLYQHAIMVNELIKSQTKDFHEKGAIVKTFLNLQSILKTFQFPKFMGKKSYRMRFKDTLKIHIKVPKSVYIV
jgi:hypothetical protein